MRWEGSRSDGFGNNTLLRSKAKVHQGNVCGKVRFPEGFGDGAKGGFVRAADLFEAGEVMRAEEVLTGFVHRFEIEVGEAALPGAGGQERVFFPVDEVGIGALFRTEAGVEVIRGRKDRVDRDGTRQDGI